MVINLMAKSYILQVYNCTKEKTEEVVGKSAIYCPRVKDCMQGVDSVISMVGYPIYVEDITLEITVFWKI